MALSTIGEETITVGNSAVGFSSDPLITMPVATALGKWDMPGVEMARVYVVSGAINFSLIGTLTAPTDGGNFDLAEAKGRFSIWGWYDLQNFRAIRNGGVDAVIKVEYEGTIEPTRQQG